MDRMTLEIRYYYYYSYSEMLFLLSVGSTLHQKATIALDPGVRTFLTGYDPSGAVIEIGKGATKRLERLNNYLNGIDTKMSKAKSCRQRVRLRKASLRLRARIRNLTSELHHLTAAYLVRNYKVILLPEFKVSQMIQKKVFSFSISRAAKSITHFEGLTTHKKATAHTASSKNQS